MATAVARRYAKAVFELAEEDGDVAAWSRRLATVSELLSNPDVAAVLKNPTIATEDREALITATKLLDTEGTNLVRLLIEAGRIDEAKAVQMEFESMADEAAGRVRATATTALALDRREHDRVERELSERLGREVRLSVTVDPRVIGGLKLQYGDHVVDATVAARLDQLRRRLTAT